MPSGPLAFDTSSFFKRFRTSFSLKRMRLSLALVRGRTLGNLPSVKSFLPKEHLDAKNFPKTSAFSLLVDASDPSLWTNVGMSLARPSHPPA